MILCSSNLLSVYPLSVSEMIKGRVISSPHVDDLAEAAAVKANPEGKDTVTAFPLNIPSWYSLGTRLDNASIMTSTSDVPSERSLVMSLRRFVGNKNRTLIASLAFVFVAALTTWVGISVSAQRGRSGTTLATVKTLDICDLGPDAEGNVQWKYSGEIAVWNEGVAATTGFTIQDCIQNKTGAGQYEDVPNLCVSFPGTIVQPDGFTEIPPGTTQLTALVFKYTIIGPPLTGDIRNIARVKITNHSGHLDTPFGPEPKASWTGGVPPQCPTTGCPTCSYSQGYFKTHPEAWPLLIDLPLGPDTPFFMSGMTWMQVLSTSPGGNGYFILAKQYIAAVLNQARGACVPSGVQETITQATNWFSTNTQGTDKIGTGKDAIPATGCYVTSACGVQKDWGAILESYNLGGYEDGPDHCGDDDALPAP
jgi:hypothetical protein